MYTKPVAAIVLMVLLQLMQWACRSAATSDAGGSKNAPAINSNSRDSGVAEKNGNVSPVEPPKAPSDAKASGAKAPAATLIGTYEIREIQDKGVINMMSQMKTDITFLTDGSYSRVSSKQGKVYHTDSGQFHIEGDDQLVLSIQMVKNNVQTRPLERKHTFSLSPDGEELKLTSSDGKVAVFKRVRKP